MEKIKEKLTGGSSSNNNEQSKLQKQPPEGYSNTSSGNTGTFTSNRTGDNTSGGSTYVQNPISSTGGRPTGTAVDNYGSTSTSNTGTQGTLPTGGMTDRYNQPGTTATEGPRQPYDPFSATGQQTAAGTAAGPPSTQREGILLNQHEKPPLEARSGHGPTQPYSTGGGVPQQQTTSTTTSSGHHYGRDAGIAGGTGAAGIGAYEAGKIHGGSGATGHGGYDPRTTTSQQPLTSQHGIGSTTAQPPSGASYISRDNIGQQNQNNRPFQDESAGLGGAGAMGSNTMGSSTVGGGGIGSGHGVGGDSAGLSESQKMSGAYEAGYRDAIEHVKADMERKQPK